MHYSIVITHSYQWAFLSGLTIFQTFEGKCLNPVAASAFPVRPDQQKNVSYPATPQQERQKHS